MRWITCICALALTVGSACASSGSREGPPRSRDLLTAEEISGAAVTTAYEAVSRLRPEFLRSRGATSVRAPSPTERVVYVDNVRTGGVDALRNILAVDVLHIRLISAGDATTRYGTGHMGGVLEVTTRRR